MEELFIGPFTQLVTVPFLISLLCSLLDDGIRDLGHALAGRKARRERAVADALREFKEKGDWSRLVENAWTRALGSREITDQSLLHALAEKEFTNSLFADLSAGSVIERTVELVVAERERNSNLAVLPEEQLRNHVPAIYREFLRIVSRDELLGFLYHVAHREGIFKRLLKEHALTREQLETLVSNSTALQSALDRFFMEYTSDSQETKASLAELKVLLESRIGEEKASTVSRPTFDAEAYIDLLLDNWES